MRFLILFFAFFSLCIAFLPVQNSFARLEIHPRLSVGEEFNDNIYLDNTDEKSDFITRISPGISTTLTRKYFDFSLDYGFFFRKYSRYSEEDETNIKDTQRGRLDFTLFPENSFSVLVTDEYSRVTIDKRRPTVEENISVNTTNKNLFHFSPQYRFPGLSTWDITLSYVYENIYYQEKVGDDFDSHSGHLDIVKRLSSKLSLLGGVGSRFYQSETEPDYRRDDLSAGFSYQMTARLFCLLTGGVANIDYKDNSGDVKTNLFNIKIDYRYSEALVFSIGFLKDFSDSVDLGLIETQEAYVSSTLSRWFTIDGRLFFSTDKYENENREDQAIGFILDSSLPMSEKRLIGARGSYSIFKYTPEDDNAYRYSIGAYFQQKFRWLSTSIGYSYNVSDNNETISDNYTNNIAYINFDSNF